MNQETALAISSEFLPNLLNLTLNLLNENENDYIEIDTDDMAQIAETVQKIGGIANNAATNLLIDNIHKIMRVELTGTWLGEIIIHNIANDINNMVHQMVE